ncbi:MAG: primosomal protein N', partial [Deltaproteobacteria bacterium]|nr:primosomal protein N' [Deltaproteobacteria bacterium]
MTKTGLMPIVEVSVPAAGIPDALKYELPDSLWADDLVGRRVKVTLRNRPVAGVITGAFKIPPTPPFLKGGKLKPIECLLDEKPVITPEQIKLARFVANYYMAPLGEVLRLCLPPNTPRTLKKDKLPKRRKKKKEAEVEQKAEPVELNDEQKEALGKITHVVMPAEAGIQNKAGVTGLDASLRWHDKTAFLLEGITGSGKTEVYIHAAQWARAQNKSVLVVVPEIALTLQLCDRFASQLGEAPLMLHSGLRNTQRYDVFETLLKGEPKILLGARSALFAPLSNLGLIVIDEEHDPSFKQDDTPRYHARDVALWRAKQEGAKIILGSATPSLESRLNAKQGKLTHLKLTKRASSNSTLPKIELIDLKSRAQHDAMKQADKAQSEGQDLCILSNPLKLAMQEVLAQSEQVLLFLNRRGYASLTICDACGSQIHCPNCAVSLTYHQKQNRYCCHQCDYFVSISMTCPSCHEGPILRLGVGTERIEQEVALFFPDVKTARLDRDSASSPKK